ncbi:PaaI family thioesterase [Bradyrhizobium sp. Pear76]|uniref:PaaI family thioesterase n=1 Tax=Bradyrhizobium oropedii TaxID=1571201 RepID=UPI001E5FAF58|nr:PaaI family thioesterase [Bradyrhizobium oropedii]MCC8964826.1 PaaI family thioesterase [Bradyrhizobium oropedii]
MTASPPEGFKLLPNRPGFIDHNGPYYWRESEAGPEWGFQSDERHGNPYGYIHGGAILGFLDTALGSAVFVATKRKCATVSLDSRFVSGTAPGSWIIGRTIVKKITRTFAFVDGEAFAGDKLLVTAAAVFRVFDE